MRTLSENRRAISLQRGFTLVELLITLVIIATILTISTLSVINIKQRASLQTTVQVFISDMRQQQLKAMIGDTGGRTTADAYGVHVLSDSYILFHGTTYNPAGTGNFTVSFGDNVYASAGSDIVFSQVSGETGTSQTITLTEKTTGDQKTISVNKYGVVTGVN